MSHLELLPAQMNQYNLLTVYLADELFLTSSQPNKKNKKKKADTVHIMDSALFWADWALWYHEWGEVHLRRLDLILLKSG